MMTNKNKVLFNLDELSDYKVASNYSDVRGWDVKDKNDRTVGKVDHLLVNKNEERVVYLDVEVDASFIEEGVDAYHIPVSEGIHDFLNNEGENHLIIPIGMAIIDEDNKCVRASQIDSQTFATAKRHRKDEEIGFEYERNALRHYRGDHTIHGSDSSDGFYDREEFNNPRSGI